ncbi:hypothetical protein J6590_004768 [Homalodisca vitripennis]|nr:hypothetical protein J6590_004768 [Homalodisca vitripennis]
MNAKRVMNKRNNIQQAESLIPTVQVSKPVRQGSINLGPTYCLVINVIHSEPLLLYCRPTVFPSPLLSRSQPIQAYRPSFPPPIPLPSTLGGRGPAGCRCHTAASLALALQFLVVQGIHLTERRMNRLGLDVLHNFLFHRLTVNFIATSFPT